MLYQLLNNTPMACSKSILLIHVVVAEIHSLHTVLDSSSFPPPCYFEQEIVISSGKFAHRCEQNVFRPLGPVTFF